MNEPLVGLIGIILLVVLMFLKMPIGFNMIFIGFIGFAVLKGISPALVNMWVIPPRLIASYDMAVLPLFLFMGILIAIPASIGYIRHPLWFQTADLIKYSGLTNHTGKHSHLHHGQSQKYWMFPLCIL